MRFGVRCLISAALWLSSAALAAETLAEKNQALSARVEEMDAQLKDMARQKGERQEQLKQLEKKYGELSNALQSIKLELARQEQQQTETRRKIAALQQDIQKQQTSLARLLQSAYALSSQDGLGRVLNQFDPALSLRMPVYYDFISQAGVRKLQALQSSRQALEQLESELLQESETLTLTLRQKQHETEALQALKQEREQLLAQLNVDYQTKRQEMQRLALDQKKLSNLITSLQKSSENDKLDGNHRQPAQPLTIHENPVNPRPTVAVETPATYQSFKELQGKLPWPVTGSIGAHFGERRFETRWDGVLINAREGADIRAVAPGRVAYADWLRGYGMMLIIDHGQGYMSLYAFNQNLRKKAGDPVQAGEVIGAVGRSGGRAQSALYFGVRIAGKAVNPELWCK